MAPVPRRRPLSKVSISRMTGVSSSPIISPGYKAHSLVNPHIRPALKKNVDVVSRGAFLTVIFLSAFESSFATFFLSVPASGSSGLFLVAVVCQSALFELHRRLSFQRLFGIGWFFGSQSTGAKDTSIHNRTAAPPSEQAEMDGARIISDSEDDDRWLTPPSRRTRAKLDSSGICDEDEDEWMEDADEFEERQDSHLANDCAVTGWPEARTPITTMRGAIFGLSGKTLSGPTFDAVIRLPIVANERPALEPNERAGHSLVPSALRDSEKIPDALTPYSGLGWVNETPKKLNTGAMVSKIGKPLTRGDQKLGILYIRKHTRYNNVYKIGFTKKTMEDREETSPSCVSDWTVEVHTTKRIWGVKRAEDLAKLYLAAWNVDLQICAHCDCGRESSTSHTEWFAGELEDIRRCLDFWVDFVGESYKGGGGAFTGSTTEILRRGLSSEKRRRRPAQGSRRLRDGLDGSPLAACGGARPAPQASTDWEGLYERANEAMVNLRRLLLAEQDPSDAHNLATPERTAPRGERPGMSRMGARNCARGVSCELCRQTPRCGLF